MYTCQRIGADPKHPMYDLWEISTAAGTHICTVIGEGDARTVVALLNTVRV